MEKIYTIIDSVNGIGQFMTDLSTTDEIGFDLETSGLGFMTDDIRLAQVEINGKIYIFNFDVAKNPDKLLHYLIQLLEGSNVNIIAHNAKFEIKFSYAKTGILLTNVFDTQVAEAILTAGIGTPYPKLSDLVSLYCGVKLDKDVRMDFVENESITEEMLIYSALDVKYLREIKKLQIGTAINEKMKQVFDLEMQLVPVVAKMEYDGVLLDWDGWLKLAKDAEKRAVELEEELKNYLFDNTWDSVKDKVKDGIDAYKAYKIPVPSVKNSKVERVDQTFLKSLTSPDFIKKELKYVWNINSNYQVKRAINLLGFSVESTGKKILKGIDTKDIFVKGLLEYRKLSKVVSTYGENWEQYINPVTGRIHADFNQVGTSTGRWSSSNPNLQNIPRTNDYRNLFKARPGYKILTCDYSQAELRLAGNLANEQNIINAYIKEEDIHAKTATIIYEVSLDEVYADKELPDGETKEMRSKGKTINFAVIYGATAYRIAIENDNISKDEAEIFIKRLFEGYPQLAEFIKEVSKSVWELKFSRTPFGRVRYFEDRTVFESDKERGWFVAKVMREGVNHIVQGGSADILKIAMVDMFYNCPFDWDDFRFLIQVHDEVVVEVKDEIWDEAREYLIDAMQRAEQPFLGDIPAVADCTKEKLDYWNKD